MPMLYRFPWLMGPANAQHASTCYLVVYLQEKLPNAILTFAYNSGRMLLQQLQGAN